MDLNEKKDSGVGHNEIEEGEMARQELFPYLPVEVFPARKNHYVFDAGKVVFLEVDEITSTILSLLRERNLPLGELIRLLPRFSKTDIREALREIHRLQEKGYLRPVTFEREMRFSRAEFEEALSRRMSGLSVNITTRCNLGCSYCIYGGSYSRYRKLTKTTMSWPTAKNMLDFLIERSRVSDRIQLDFFGGEPLLAFKLMDRCVDYLKAGVAARGTQILVTIASNGTILTDDILRFLRAHDVYLQFSIDGDREVHDRKRRYKSSGRGSYERVVRNLERIHEFDPSYFEKHMRIKSVITLDTLDLDDEKFFDHPLLCALNDKGQVSIVFKETHYRDGEDSDYFEHLGRIRRKLLARRRVRTLDELLSRLNPRECVFFHSEFGDFLDVQAVNAFYLASSTAVPFRKGCLMGCENAIVEPDGKILVCHKATSFVIGNVNEGGWDFDTIWEIYRGLHRDWPECASCFVQRFCDLCFEKLDGGGVAASRRSFCDFTRKKYRIVFDTMLRVLEQNPALWGDFRAIVSRNIKERIEEFRAGSL